MTTADSQFSAASLHALHRLPAAVLLESWVLTVPTGEGFLLWGLQMGFMEVCEPLKSHNPNLMDTFCKGKEGPIVFIISLKQSDDHHM